MFKVGDRVRVINTATSPYKDNGIPFEVGDVTTVTAVEREYFRIGNGSIGNNVRGKDLELVTEPDPKQQPFTPTIEIDFLIDYILDNGLTSNEIVAFLKRHNKGQVFIHENLK